jgi:hypothetical protein
MTITSERAEISRRRVLQGVAWAAPAVVVATAVPAAAASTVNPLAGTTLSIFTHSGNTDYADITFPAAATLASTTVTVTWVPGGGGPSAALTAPGVTWSPTSSATSPVNFATGNTINPGTVVRITLTKPMGGSAVTIVISAYVNGSPTLSTITLSGNVS